MTLKEIFSIIDKIKPNEEFYNPDINKSIILTKNGSLSFSDGENPFNVKYMHLKFIRREKKKDKKNTNDSVYNEQLWTQIDKYLNTDQANLISISELEKNNKHNTTSSDFKLANQLYPNLLYSLNPSEIKLYKQAKGLQSILNQEIRLDFKHNLLIDSNNNVYQAKHSDSDFTFETIGNLNDNFKRLKKDDYDNKNIIFNGIGTNNTNNKFPNFSESMAKAFIKGEADLIKDPLTGNYQIVSNGMKNLMKGKYSLIKDQKHQLTTSLHYNPSNIYDYNEDSPLDFLTAECFFDATLVLINNYESRFSKKYFLGDDSQSNISFGYNQSAIIKTLLAFACECYMKSLLSKSGQNLKTFSHSLVKLFTALDTDEQVEILSNIENNKQINSEYKSKYLPYSDPRFENQFIIELAKVDEAFVDSRYCWETKKNINYEFLMQLASSLKNIASKKISTESYFNK